MTRDKSDSRLLYSICYLSGPIDNCRDKGRIWRNDLSQWLIGDLGVIPLNPYHKPTTNGLEDDDVWNYTEKCLATGDYNALKIVMKEVVAYDLRCIDKCDFVIAYMDMDYSMCGTIDEICMASTQNKPVIVCCPQGKRRIPRWLYGRLKPELFFENMVETKQYLTYIAYDKNIETYDRWKFFNLSNYIKKISEI